MAEGISDSTEKSRERPISNSQNEHFSPEEEAVLLPTLYHLLSRFVTDLFPRPSSPNPIRTKPQPTRNSGMAPTPKPSKPTTKPSPPAPPTSTTSWPSSAATSRPVTSNSANGKKPSRPQTRAWSASNDWIRSLNHQVPQARMRKRMGR